MTSSCHGCASRFVGCHASCESYKAYAAELSRIRLAKYKAKEENDYMITQKLKQARAR